jgi:serine/threonine-protein kinase
MVDGQVAAAVTELEAADPLLAAAAARVGSTLRGKWRLEKLLGIGGMAAVYAATHRNGTRAAVKVLHAQLSMTGSARQRFAWEGRAANAVGHPGAVRILDDDVAEDGALFLVTELLEGETLEDRRLRHGGRLSNEEVLLVFDHVLDVLAAAHARGIVHRDLKPENLFLTCDGRVKVLDFGISRMRDASDASRLTLAGESMGTPAYMAPEHARGLWDEVDERSDLWSVGATMFHLLSGVVVHDGRTVNEQLLAAMTRPAPPLSTALPGVPAVVAGVVDRALSFEKDKRWPDAETMRMAVGRASLALRECPSADAVPALAPRSASRSASHAVPSAADDARPAPVRALAARSATRPPGDRTTERPVEITLIPPALAAASLQTRVAVFVLGAILVGGAVAAVVGPVKPRRAPPVLTAAAPSPSSPTFSSEPTANDSVLAVPPEPTTPLVAATDLPAAPVPPTAPAKRPTSAPGARAQTDLGDVAPACSPPYEVDPKTGHKRWKVECL